MEAWRVIVVALVAWMALDVVLVWLWATMHSNDTEEM